MSNREIKFRGLTQEREWLYGSLWRDASDKATNILHLGGLPLTRNQVHPETVGQYTGLKDKFGVMIYEHDIVRLRFHGIDGADTFENGVIRWHEGSSGFKWINGDDANWNHHWLSRSDTDYREVIGNIHEHAHLLTTAEDESK